MDEKNGNEMLIEGIEANVQNLKNESGMYPKKLAHMENIVKRIDTRMEIMNRLNDALVDGLKKKVSEFIFEDDPHFWDAKKDLQMLEHEVNIEKMLTERETLVEQIGNIKTEIERIARELPKAEAELADARGE